MASTSTVRIVFTGNASGATRALKQVEGSFGGIGKAAKIAGAAIVGGLAVGLTAAVKQAIGFDRSMRNVNSIAKLSEKQFQSLSKQVLALSKETAKAPKDLADGLYDIVSSGFQAGDAVKVLAVSAKAATAGLSDTKTASAAVSAALNAYHLSANDARQVSDVLFQTVNKGVLTFEQLAQNMGDLVPAAAPLGISLEEVGAAIATITLQGVPAAEAATRVKNSMLALAKPGDNLKKLFKEAGFASGEAAVKALGYAGVLDLVNKATGGSVGKTQSLFSEMRAGLGIIGLTGRNLSVYEKNLRAMEQATDGAGATAAAFAEQSKSISFQWDKAKASLAAAAVPLGQLLFPALIKGAELVGDFAGKVESKLPQIKAQFGGLASAAGDLAGGLAQIAGQREAQAVIVGLLAGGATIKGVTTFQKILATVKALPPGLSLAAAAVGILGGALYLTATQGDRLRISMDRVVAAIRGVSQSAQDEEQAHLRVQGALTQVQAANVSLERAKKNLALVEGDAGKKSLEYREAQLLVRQAQDQVKQSTIDLRNAKQEASRAERTNSDAAKKSAAIQKEVARDIDETLSSLENVYRVNAQAAGGLTRELQRQQEVARNRVVEQYADAIRAAFVKLGSSKKDADLAADSVADLSEELGRLPTLKEIRLNLDNARVMRAIQDVGRAVANLPTSKTINLTVAIRRTGPGGPQVPGLGPFQPRATGGFITRATGGFVPLMPGSSKGADSVPALLTPGEVVLNRQQQDRMGGPAVFQRMFGFATGGVVPTASTAGPYVQLLQAGGLVAYPASSYGTGAGTTAKGVRTSMLTPSPKMKRGRSYSKLTGAAKRALAAVEAVKTREDAWDRRYGQMARGFNITQEDFIDIAVDEYGQEYEVLNQGQIDQRLGELSSLIGQRQGMQALIDEELGKLRAAIGALEKAIVELLAEIEREQERAREEQRKVNQLRDELADNRRAQARNEREQNELVAERERVSRLPEPKTQAAKAKRKQYENQLEDEAKRLDQEAKRLQGQEGTLGRQIDKHESLKAGHYRKAESLQGQVRDFRQAKAEAQASLRDEVPLDRADVGLEIRELQAEETEVRAIRPAAKPPPPTARLAREAEDAAEGEARAREEAAAEADRVLTTLPGDIDLALANAELTDTFADDREALRRAEAFFAGNLGKGSVAAQASVARALKAVRDQIAQLERDASAPGLPDTSGPDISPTGGGGPVQEAESEALKGIIAELERQLGLARLAVGVQAAQFRVIGSFAKGTLHVPFTGLAQVHAGEQILTSAKVSSAPSASTFAERPVQVQMNFANGMEWLAEFVDVRVVSSQEAISDRIGRRANMRLRSGRYTILPGRG